jgi:hypothetical protein
MKERWIPGQARNDKTAAFVDLSITTQSGKPESSHFNRFWTPAPAHSSDTRFAEVTGLRLFVKTSVLNSKLNVQYSKFNKLSNILSKPNSEFISYTNFYSLDLSQLNINANCRIVFK